MTANKNEPEKKPAGSATAQPGARPHATLDLKATDVTPPAAAAKEKPEKDKPEVAATSEKAKPAAAATAAGPSVAPTASAASSKAEKPGTGAPTGGAAAHPTGRGHGGFFTHVAAGLAGGIIALALADILAGQLGFETPDKTPAIEQRLNAIEAAQRQRATPTDLTTRLAAAESKLGKLDQLEANIDGVSRKQAELDKGLNTLGDSVREQSGDTQTGTRIAKLEEQLSLMATAAERDPQSGRLPQLTAISGRLVDLESTVSNQLDALRKNVAQELDTRLTAATEAGEAARSGTQRIDRELSTIKAESAELSTGLAALKTDSDRTAAAIRTTQEDLKRLKTDIDTRFAGAAKPEDVSSAVAPLDSKLAALQQDVQGVIKSEGDRRTTAERIVLSLELANLKRAIDRGKPYAAELAQTRKIAGDKVDLAPLERFARDGVPNATELKQEFKPVAFKIIDAVEQPGTESSIVDRLLAGAKSVVRVRKTTHSADDKSVEATVARIEAALNEDRLTDILELAKSLPPPARDAAQDFLAKVEARAAVDGALASVETQLKSSLAAAPADSSGKAAQ